jgi:GntR family transcriptional regulator/MocR family aminotransferase
LKLYLNIPTKKRTLKQSVYRQIVKQLQSSSIQSGEKMPSIRALAEQINTSRITIEEIYAELVADGWIESRPRKGYYTCETLKSQHKNSSLTFLKDDPLASDFLFSTGGPDKSLVPFNTILKTSSALGTRSENLSILARYIEQTKGITDGVLTTSSGSLEALYLILRALKSQRGNKVLALEQFSYRKVTSIAEQLEIETIHLKMDEHGVIPTELEKHAVEIDLLYLTTQFQFPTTIKMPMSRKLELIQIAKKNKITIIEDDYESEFFYSKYQSPSIYSLTQGKGTIFISTFSNLISSKFRIGYIITNEALSTKVAHYRELFSPEKSDTIVFALFCNWIQTGGLEKFLRKSRKIYHARSKNLFSLISNSNYITKHFLLKEKIAGGTAAWLKCVDPNPAKLKKFLERQQINLYWSNYYTTKKSRSQYIRIGFAKDDESLIAKKISKLESALRHYK